MKKAIFLSFVLVLISFPDNILAQPDSSEPSGVSDHGLGVGLGMKGFIFKTCPGKKYGGMLWFDFWTYFNNNRAITPVFFFTYKPLMEENVNLNTGIGFGPSFIKNGNNTYTDFVIDLIPVGVEFFPFKKHKFGVSVDTFLQFQIGEDAGFKPGANVSVLYYIRKN